MTRPLALLVLLAVSVSACGREAPAPASNASATSQTAAQTQPSTASGKTAVQTETEQATAAQESVADTTGEDAGDASLERLAALPPQQQLPDGKWKAGTNYQPIVPGQPTNVAPGKVEVLEVFWYGCPHCYALEPYLKSWDKNKPDYVQFVRAPVMWGPVHRAHAKLFYTIEALGRPDLHQKVFETIHQKRNMLAANDEASTVALQIEFAKENGVDEKAFRQAFDSFTVNSNLQRAEDLTKRYRIEGVPLIVVNGKYQTDVSKAGGSSQLISLINDLTANERPR